MDQEEIWKDIKGFEGLYQISNLGRVRSLDRLVRSGHGSFKLSKGKIRKPSIDRYGYYRIDLWKAQKASYITIHRLVAEAFIPNPENKKAVNHINCIKTDNRVENLEWCTNQENSNHAVANNLYNPKKGKDCNFTKLKEEDVIFIRENYNKKTLNQKALADMFGVCDSLISQILKRKIWKHI